VTSLGLIENCRRRKIAPWKYLVRIFEKPLSTKVTAEAFAAHTLAAYAEKIHPHQHAIFFACWCGRIFEVARFSGATSVLASHWIGSDE
jgi:hypothetical protein